MFDFQTISLINSSCKIISKVLTNRLSQVINDLVDNSQSAFIKDRCIFDNIIATQELIFSLQKCKLPRLAFMVDFAKAFDSLDWNFLLEVVAARGFRSRWIYWVKIVLNSAKDWVLIMDHCTTTFVGSNADDLIIFLAGGHEDLQIIKLILYLILVFVLMRSQPLLLTAPSIVSC